MLRLWFLYCFIIPKHEISNIFNWLSFTLLTTSFIYSFSLLTQVLVLVVLELVCYGHPKATITL